VHAAPAAHDGLAISSRDGRLALLATVGASGMAGLDATVVNLALPRIGAELGARAGTLQWVLTAYLLGLASLVLLAGALGDRVGRRRVFTLGVAWFALASLACAVAPSIEYLVAARLLQGIGAALLTPGSLSILQASFRPADRAAAIGAWSGFGALAGAIGPFVGGLLVDGPGWRWAFVINVPLGIAVLAASARAVPETIDPNVEGRLDLVGAALVVVALASGTLALAATGSAEWTVPAAFVATLTTVGFVWRIRRAQHPLVPPTLFRDRTFATLNVATVLLYGPLTVSFFLLAYQLQVTAGWSALEVGLVLLPVTLLLFLLSGRSSALAQRIGPRLQLTGGPLLASAGLLLLADLGADAVWLTDVLPGSVLFALGISAFVAPLTATVMASADPDHVSVASGVNNALARTAALAALAVVPAASGLSAAMGDAEVTSAFRRAMLLAAGGAASAAVCAFVGLRPGPATGATRQARRDADRGGRAEAMPERHTGGGVAP
jgi:EmrB/QacA subfamily drug resistance transporter